MGVWGIGLRLCYSAASATFTDAEYRSVGDHHGRSGDNSRCQDEGRGDPTSIFPDQGFGVVTAVVRIVTAATTTTPASAS
ncbi:hypothetical protein BX666DRAFT_1997617 [Dichotomocladium elegans]|nr:hypothetical protein BX666DRAFT_1997617 [Dichotomocladium elegans]